MTYRGDEAIRSAWRGCYAARQDSFCRHIPAVESMG